MLADAPCFGPKTLVTHTQGPCLDVILITPAFWGVNPLVAWTPSRTRRLETTLA